MLFRSVLVQVRHTVLPFLQYSSEITYSSIYKDSFVFLLVINLKDRDQICPFGKNKPNDLYFKMECKNSILEILTADLSKH